MVGIGPGGPLDRTFRAQSAIEASEVIAGYKRYIKAVDDLIGDKTIIATGMTKEVDRCQQAIKAASEGKKVMGEFTATNAPSLLQDSEAQAIEQSQLPALSKKTLLAAWLAKQGGWHFEAYQRIASITGYYPAQLVKQGLEMGKRP